MVTPTRAPSRPRCHQREPQLTSLNQPVPLKVATTGQEIRAIHINGRCLPVKSIQDTWVVNEEWWRQVIHRQYYVLLTAEDTVYTVFRDLAIDTWYLQHYPYPTD